MSAVEAHGAVRVCATCGQAMTHVGPDGECMRCLVSFGFLSDEQHSEEDKSDKQVRPGPLRYAHFEVEINADGFPKILGSGAMAVTYCARDTILESTAALKVIARKLAADPTARARFLREARAAAQIQHPNVARVSHYGEQDGECLYAMELVHGETLEERVQRDGPLPLSLALEVVEQTARGLAAGEACGVIHRDLKPSNVMTESEPSGQTLVKIIDYGVAKVMVSDPTLQTQAGFIGTPAFASPEQFNELGQQQVDTRSDIYSLGIVFWYLLTGQTPFAGQSLEQVRAKQKQQLPLEQLTMKGCEQPPQFHPEGDVFKHTRIMLGLLPAEVSLPLVFSVLFHDIGKPPTATDDEEGRIRFNGHDRIGAEMTEAIMERLRFSRAEIDATVEAVRQHMVFKDVPNMRVAKLKRFMARPTFEDELELHRVDCASSHAMLDNYEFLLKKKEEFANEPIIPPPLVRGDDLIALGMKPGPRFGEILEAIETRQLEGALKNREEALAWVRKEVEGLNS